MTGRSEWAKLGSVERTLSLSCCPTEEARRLAATPMSITRAFGVLLSHLHVSTGARRRKRRHNSFGSTWSPANDDNTRARESCGPCG